MLFGVIGGLLYWHSEMPIVGGMMKRTPFQDKTGKTIWFEVRGPTSLYPDRCSSPFKISPEWTNTGVAPANRVVVKFNTMDTAAVYADKGCSQPIPKATLLNNQLTFYFKDRNPSGTSEIGVQLLNAD